MSIDIEQLTLESLKIFYSIKIEKIKNNDRTVTLSPNSDKDTEVQKYITQYEQITSLDPSIQEYVKNSLFWKKTKRGIEYALPLLDTNTYNIDLIAECIHNGWRDTTQEFLDNPMVFSETNDLINKNRLDLRMNRIKSMVNLSYSELDMHKQSHKTILLLKAESIIKAFQQLH